MKKVGVIIFFGLIGFSLLYFYINSASREFNVSSLRNNEPRLIIDDMTNIRYRGNEKITQLRSRLAQFNDPNVIELFGDVEYQDYQKENVRNVFCQSARATLNTETTTELMKADSVQVFKAILDNSIVIQTGDYRLETDFAKYHAPSNLISSNQSVRVRTIGRSIIGETGFKFNLTKENLEVYGPVSGVILNENN